MRRQRGGAGDDAPRRVIRDGGGRRGRRAGGACQLVVDMPLAKCNATLPAAGALVSSLQGPLAGMLGGVFRFAPAGFSFRMN